MAQNHLSFTGRPTTTDEDPGRGGTPYSGLYGEAPPERHAFFMLAVNKRGGKIAILVKGSQSRLQSGSWWLKYIYQKVPNFGRNNNDFTL